MYHLLTFKEILSQLQAMLAKQYIIGLWLGFVLVFLVGCEDEEEKKLMTLQKEQEAKILALEAELDVIKTEIEEKKVEDPTPMIQEIEAKIATADAEIENLQAELAPLEADKAKITKEFETYKESYPIR